MNASAKVLKQLGEYAQPPAVSHVCCVHVPFGCVPAGVLGLGEWQLYCRALETFLRQVATHTVLSKNKAVEIFLTNSDVSGQKGSNAFFFFLRKIVKRRHMMRDILVKL